MAEMTPFIVEAVLVLVCAVILQCFCLRQLYHDWMAGEKWRPLIVCHMLTEVACILHIVGNIDPQGGFGVYHNAESLLIGNIRSVCLVASARALAAGFVASYQLMTTGPQSSSGKFSPGAILLIQHAVFLFLGCILFFFLLTKNAWVSVAVKFFVSFYSIVVSSQVIIGTYKVRRILMEEHKRTGKYSEGIYKLTRLFWLVLFLVVVGNASIYTGMSATIQNARTTGLIAEEGGTFSTFHVVSDFAGLIALGALILGSWKVDRGAPKTGVSKRTTRSSTTAGSQDKKSTPKIQSRELHEDASPDIIVDPVSREASAAEEVYSLAEAISPVKSEDGEQKQTKYQELELA